MVVLSSQFVRARYPKESSDKIPYLSTDIYNAPVSKRENKFSVFQDFEYIPILTHFEMETHFEKETPYEKETHF